VRIERIELRLLRLPLVRFFETSFGRIDDRAFVLVTVEDDGAVGVGECVADERPFYSSETTRTAWHIVADFLSPMVLGRTFVHPREVFDSLALVRGHHMAKAAIEMAAWDLFARQQNRSLAEVLGGSETTIANGIASGSRSVSRHRSTSWWVASMRSSPPDIAASRSRSSQGGISNPCDVYVNASGPSL